MSGEINGTHVVISKGTAIVGQGAATLTINGTPIDISNKSNNDYITLLDGESAGRQLVFGVELVYNDDTSYAAVRADTLSGTMDTYSIEYTSANTTDESFSGTFMPNGMSDNIGHGEAIKTSITFSSSGAFTHTPAVA